MAFSAVFSALEVVPLTLLTLDAWDFIKGTRTQTDLSGRAIAVPHQWTFYFIMAVGAWNFVGAGIFGSLINLPIVSYFEVGTLLTVNHGHAARLIEWLRTPGDVVFIIFGVVPAGVTRRYLSVKARRRGHA